MVLARYMVWMIGFRLLDVDRKRRGQCWRSRVERAAGRLYHNAVSAIVDEIKSYIGFTQRDAEHLRSLATVVEPALDRVVDRFYEEIDRHATARQVISTAQRRACLRSAFRAWLTTLFSGTYDESYLQRRSRIGHTHVRVGLPQHLMFAAMEVVWQELHSIVRTANPPSRDEKLAAIHKLLTIEITVMLDSYRTSYMERVRSVEREAIHERLARAEQLAEIGQLAASLAHEIKNPLAGISGAIQVLRDDMTPDDPRRAVLEEALRQVTRLDGTIKDLLAYARPTPPQKGPCRLGPIVGRVATLLRAEAAARGIDIAMDTPPDLPAIEADEHQIEQLLINLLLNAIHASQSGDVVRIVCTGVDDALALTVEDHGRGMEPATARRAFEPFFTTKSRGTGLGLPICRRIVDGHGGSIDLRSRPGRGTVVEVRFPRGVTGGDRERAP